MSGAPSLRIIWRLAQRSSWPSQHCLAAACSGVRQVFARRTHEKPGTSSWSAKRMPGLASAIAGLKAGIALFDENDRMVVANPTYCQIHEIIADLLVPGSAPFEHHLTGGTFAAAASTSARMRLIAYIARRLDQHRNPGLVVERRRLNDLPSLGTSPRAATKRWRPSAGDPRHNRGESPCEEALTQAEESGGGGYLRRRQIFCRL